MTTAHLLALIIGLVALGVGLTTLVRPSITRRLLGIADSEGATYALRIGGMMLTAFGLVLVLFVAAFTAGPPAATPSSGA
jgi:uncharacterized protein YjeT (DUF2065 family)